MKVAFVGGGPASLFGALYLKQNRPDIEVYVLEKNNKIGKKLSMTGNGKCNLAPIVDDFDAYNQLLLVKNLFDSLPLHEYLEILSKFNIHLKTINNIGYYPLSESAPNVVNILHADLESFGVKLLNANVQDYRVTNNGITLKTDNGELAFDHVFFGTGGLSYPKSGSDGSLFDVFKHHGYDVKPFSPRLCPLKVKENVKDLFGARGKAICSLMVDGKVASVEQGEIMFKRDALSGVCIMNLSRFVDLSKKCEVVVNFLTDGQRLSSGEIKAESFLLSYVSEPIAKYVLKLNGVSPSKVLKLEEQDKLVSSLANLKFIVTDLYDYENAQITRGGISISDINNHFESLKEKGISFIGEMLDVDAKCGGYNLRFAITSGLEAVKILFNK